MGLEAFIQAAEFQDDCETECWREDSLCRYFELMEKLQLNLEEMDQLQDTWGVYERQAFSWSVIATATLHMIQSG